YSAVMNYVHAVFGTHVNIGKGIRAMLVKRLERSGQVTVLERSKIETLQREQDYGVSPRVRQGTQARIGRIVGADAILMGDIVIFGRDDKRVQRGGTGRAGGVWAGLGEAFSESKAVVGV